MITLPVTHILPELRQALAQAGRAVLQAPPGAGKTTLVPLDLLASGLYPGKILMLEPRRLAARASAVRMASTLGEAVGQRVGYRIRGEAKISDATRIEVVTEGILTRMIQGDPELSGISCVIFDEFHERSLQADLGLALVLELRAALRPDLAVLVMSATLDAAPVAALMQDAPVLTAEGRAFPVETRWLPRPVDASLRFEAAMAGLIRQALGENPEGGLLAFLPGEAEIRRLAALLDPLPGCVIRPLYGAMDFASQQAALAPAGPGLRKLVLATSIAETSLTLPDIRIVVDGGKARRARFDPGSGMARLVTERVTRAEAEQRRGRAGRVAEGLCYRLWTKGEEGGMAAFPPPGIQVADLTALALELAEWGSDDLPFLTPPPEAGLSEARALLRDLGALDATGSITAHGRKLAALPLHPRLGHMLAVAGKEAAPLAALIGERDPLRGAGPELELRLQAIARPPENADRGVIERIRQEAKRLVRAAGDSDVQYSPAQMAALAYPDRIGLRRRGEAPRFLLSGGKGAYIEPGSALAKARLLVATDLDGDPREAKIRMAAALSEEELREIAADRITWSDEVIWNSRENRVQALRRERYGALVLNERAWSEAPAEALSRAALQGLRENGLSWSAAAARLRARIALTRGEDWPGVSDLALLDSAEDWLLPWLGKARNLGDLKGLDLSEALKAHLGHARMAEVDRLAPAHFTTPLGRAVPIDYEGEHPAIAVRLQEMFGVTQHPTVGQHRLPLRISLLSPRQTPVQVTLDLPGFWSNSYADVRKDMRGQYPKHPWPEDPREHEPTLRAKPRR
ncbi:ATP-dependent helicase HrpB [Pseudogemmobacter faecipullorum]|uniref:ATP-dependent helicase HrpB n=1 Tax=Pseudogemmobacter faecipullorum TaxID=2755041 RepID=A0ABS8CRD6_9RHOB|nr:ATP-dependent helicase HrpB [Pseudogemmobacter faecipullorum]MCB5411949.1 ATP-dependent helicase HrpB [Pseudogemmobacter faecipullorum]